MLPPQTLQRGRRPGLTKPSEANWLDAEEDRFRRLLNIEWAIGQNYAQPAGTALRAIFQRDRAFEDSIAQFYYPPAILGALQQVHDCACLGAFAAQLLAQGPEGRFFSRLMALPLEAAAAAYLLQERPALSWLRTQFWKERVRAYERRTAQEEGEALDRGHGERVLGRVPKLVPLQRRLLDRLEGLSGLPTTAFVAEMQELLAEEFHFQAGGAKAFHSSKKAPATKEKGQQASPDRGRALSDEELFEEMSVGSAEFNENILLDDSKKSFDQDRTAAHKLHRMRDVRAFMEANYGPSLLDAAAEARLLKIVAQGLHRKEHFLITKGFPTDPSDIDKALAEEGSRAMGSEYWHLDEGEQAARQALSALPYRQRLMRRARIDNERYVRAHARQIHRASRQLSEKIKSAIQGEADLGPSLEDHGLLLTERVWRQPILKDRKVFMDTHHEEPGRLIIDLLLDSSASQLEQKERVASQAYILTRALDRCRLPFRVTSFQSQQGYTILRQFYDYDEVKDPRAVLSYFPDAANRDGYALHLVEARMRRRSDTKNVLIVLSDGKPLDERVGINIHSFDRKASYREERAIEDTALQVRRIQESGVALFGLFTGQEEDLPAAKRIYGHSLAYIKNIDRFAEIVAQLLREEILSLR